MEVVDWCKELLSWLESQESSELIDLKKDIAGTIISKIRENHEISDFKEEMIVKYLVEDSDGVMWFLGKIRNSLLEGWMSITDTELCVELKKYKELMEKSKTNEALNDLKEGILQDKFEFTSKFQDWSSGSSQEIIQTSVDVQAAQVWEAPKIPLKNRKEWLFPNGIPTKEAEMQPYLTKITVPIIQQDWTSWDTTLTVHKKLANEYVAVFQELKNAWIKVDSKHTWAYNWRTVRRWKSLSHHSFWSAIDVNRNVNGGVYWKTDKNSDFYNGADTVAIFKKHGFARWWDRSKKNNDPMHFTYMWH